MRYSFAIAVIVVAALMSGAVGSARADQNDSRLDTLFGQLQQTNSLAEASSIAGEIWTVWTEIDDQAAYGDMLQGIEAIAEQDFETALRFFDGVITRHPAFAEGWNKRATVYYLMGRFDESMADVAVTLDLEPRHFGALAGKGLILMAKGEYSRAVKAFEHALEANPHMLDVRVRIKVLKDALKKSAI